MKCFLISLKIYPFSNYQQQIKFQFYYHHIHISCCKPWKPFPKKMKKLK
jgi:hypothetical protein